MLKRTKINRATFLLIATFIAQSCSQVDGKQSRTQRSKDRQLPQHIQLQNYDTETLTVEYLATPQPNKPRNSNSSVEYSNDLNKFLPLPTRDSGLFQNHTNNMIHIINPQDNTSTTLNIEQLNQINLTIVTPVPEEENQSKVPKKILIIEQKEEKEKEEELSVSDSSFEASISKSEKDKKLNLHKVQDSNNLQNVMDTASTPVPTPIPIQETNNKKCKCGDYCIIL